MYIMSPDPAVEAVSEHRAPAVHELAGDGGVPKM